jgi:hypothetical protein
VDNRLIAELKRAKAIADEHTAQLIGYLRASRIEHGLLLTFGAPKFEIKKYVLSQAADKPGLGGMVSSLISIFVHFVLFRG